MIRVYQKYLASHFIAPFLMSTCFFVIFLLTFQLFRIMRVVINKGVPVDIVLELVMHIAISFLPLAIPLSALFATIYTLNKLSEDSEIVALRSFGVSKGKLFIPFLAIGIVISLIVFSLNRSIIPYSKRLFKNRIIQLTSKGLLTDIKAGDFFTEIPNITLFSEEVSNNGEEMKEVFIHSRGDKTKVIYAKTGSLQKKNSSSGVSLSSVRLILNDGNILIEDHETGIVEKILFKEYDFPILNENIQPGFVTKDSMRTNDELYEIIKNTPKKDQNDKGFIKTKLEFWSRINTPLQTLIFIFLGFTLGIKKGRGKARNTGPIGLIVIVSYYAVFFTGVGIVKKGVIAAQLAVFLPTILMFFIAFRLFKRLDWVS